MAIRIPFIKTYSTPQELVQILKTRGYAILHIKKKNHGRIRFKYEMKWTCICGEVINRDENAAINIMNVGLSMV